MTKLVEFHAISLLLLMWSVTAGATMENIFLNSYNSCGRDKTFGVNSEKGYLIQADISPRTGTKSFRDCETTFHAEQENGHLCLVQEGKLNEIDDRNAELIIYDGYGKESDPIIFNLKPYVNEWSKREYCTRTRYINLYLRKIDKTVGVDIRKVYINLKVLDIRSKRRRLYLDEHYCDNTYWLVNSQVSVFNRLMPDYDVPIQIPKSSCSIRFEKERKESMRICFVYIPSSNVNCSSKWTFSVSTTLESHEIVNLYQLSCSDTLARQVHSWCGSNQTHFLSLTLDRAEGNASISSLEHPEMIRFVFADYNGTAESYLEKVKQDLGINASDGTGLDWVWIVLRILIVLIVLGITSVALFFWKRRKLFCFEYKAVHNPEKPTPL